MNYQRILSYLYDYDRGVKRKNIGFVKAETRGDLCRVNIHMKLPESCPQGIMRVYFFFRRNDEILGIPFAEASPTGTACDVRAMLPTSFFVTCGYAPDEFAGIYICSDDRKDLAFASAWDDEPVYVETFRELRPAEQTEKARSEDAELTGKTRTEETELTEKIRTEDAKPVDRKSLEEQAARAEPSKPEEQTAAAPERTPWEELARNFTKFLAADGDAPVECLKIRPHHIALLPRRYWDDTNNSFLLHGYYTYGHLILARREQGDEYFLGIPGKNCDRDRVMAAYYGYTKYLPAMRRNRGVGYWCKEISL